MTGFLGIDLNGLVDGIVGLPGQTGASRGEIPSVVVLPLKRPRGPLTVVGGEEASRAIEGRGWEWPTSACHGGPDRGLRIPVPEILEGLLRGTSVPTLHGEQEAADLAAAALAALETQSSCGTSGSAADPVLVVRDNGRFDEIVQQRLLDALARRRSTTTLLWRPVAALLGIGDKLAPIAAKLDGKRVGVVSVLADGIDVSVVSLERHADRLGAYLVPVRDRAGLHVPFDRSLIECAREVACRMLPDDPAGGWQVLWGNGLALQRLVGLPSRPQLIQRAGRWQLLDADAIADVPLPDLDGDGLAQARALLGSIHMLVMEGPAMEARGPDGRRLAHRVEDALALGRKVDYSGWRDSFTAATGAAVFAQRRASGRHTYFDFLPQIRISARVDGTPRFVALIPPDARVEGGSSYRPPPFDLGLTVRKRVERLEVYLAREGERQPRRAVIELAVPPDRDVRVRLDLEQRPAQGLARLTLLPEVDGEMPLVELDWQRMPPDPRSEAEIVQYLEQAGGKVPPLIPVQGHWGLWSAPLIQLLDRLGARLASPDQDLESCRKDLNELALFLVRRLPVRNTAETGETSWRTCRLLSTEGALPTAGDAVLGAAELLGGVLEGLGSRLPAVDLSVPGPLRNAIVKVGSWTFTACPPPVREHLARCARRGEVVNAMLDFGAMGRVFTQPEEMTAFFRLVAAQRELKRHHIEASLSLLSLRYRAALAIEAADAERLAAGTLARLREYRGVPHRRGRQKGSGVHRLPRSCMRLLAGLLRHRLRNPQFLVPGGGPLADRIGSELERIRRLDGADRRTRDLAAGVLDWMLERGGDIHILDQEQDDDLDEDAEAEE